MSRCEIFKELNDIHIYVATSVTNFGVILFTLYMDTAEFCFAVDSWRSGLRCIATVPQPAWPLKPSEKPLFHMSTHTSCAFIAANTVPDSTSCLWVETELWEASISISAYETCRNCWPESFQWRTVMHILRQMSYTNIGDIQKIDVYRYSRSHLHTLAELRQSVGVGRQ